MNLVAALRSRLAGYATVNAVAAAATFLTVPILIRLIGVDGFGTWSLLEPIIFFGAALAMLGAEHGVMKDVALHGEDVRDVLGQIMLSSGPTVLLVAAAFGGATWAFVSADLAVMVACLAACEGLLAMTLTAARAANRTGAFAVGQIGRSLGFLLLLAGALAAGLTPDLSAILTLRLALLLVLVGILAALLRPRLALAPARYFSALHYGTFILISSLVTMVLEMADRYLVGAFGGSGAVGQYMVHVKIASIVGQGIVMPFSLWFAPERLRHMNDPDGGDAFFNRVALGLTLVCCVAAGGAFLVSPLLVEIIAPGARFEPVAMAALLAAAGLIGLTYALNIGLLRPGMTHLNIAPVVLGVLAMLAIGPLLVRVLGPSGAAVARFVGTLVFLVLLARLSQRAYPVAFNYRHILAVAAVSGAVIAAIHLGLPLADGLDWGKAALRLAIFGLIAAVAGAVTLELIPLRRLAWGRAR